MCLQDVRLQISQGNQDNKETPAKKMCLQDVRHLEGWYAYYHLNPVLTAITETQERGSVGEIGVHHGKMFCALAMLTRPELGEHSLAVDLFGNQGENVDGSGHGNQRIFDENCARLLTAAQMQAREVIAINSMALRSTDLTQEAGSFRLFSIDGGHTSTCVLSDLELVAPTMTPDGVIVIDDFWHPCWPGVWQGTMLFLRRHPEWQPFYVSPLVGGTNKLMICRAPEVERYRTLCAGTGLNWYLPQAQVFPDLRTPIQNVGCMATTFCERECTFYKTLECP